MTPIAHVHRRGAMYIWRKRCPIDSPLSTETLRVSLGTRELSTAAYRAAILTRAFFLMFRSMGSKTITKAEAQSYLAAVLAVEIKGIEAARWEEVDDLSPDEWSHLLARDRTEAAALHLVADRGMAGTLLQQDMDRLREVGFTPPNMGQTMRGILEQQDTLADRDFTGVAPKPEDHFASRSLSDADLSTLRRHAMKARAIALEKHDRMEPKASELNVPLISADHATRAAAPENNRYDAGILALEKQRTERERKQRHKKQKGDASVDLKSFEKEADRRSKILAQFIELTGKSNLTDVRQEDFAFYRDSLDRIPKNYNKSPADRALPMERILERGDDLPPEQVGLSAATINRNLAFLERVLEQGALAGLMPSSPVNLKILRESCGLQRDARLAFSVEDVGRIFLHPTWHGRRSAKRMHQSGNEIVRDALYWMPLFGCYTGCRREELAGMTVDDVNLEHPVRLCCAKAC